MMSGDGIVKLRGLEDAPSTISWGRIGLEALNLTITAELVHVGDSEKEDAPAARAAGCPFPAVSAQQLSTADLLASWLA